jgi:hypothetical protein
MMAAGTAEAAATPAAAVTNQQLDQPSCLLMPRPGEAVSTRSNTELLGRAYLLPVCPVLMTCCTLNAPDFCLRKNRAGLLQHTQHTIRLAWGFFHVCHGLVMVMLFLLLRARAAWHMSSRPLPVLPQVLLSCCQQQQQEQRCHGFVLPHD